MAPAAFNGLQISPSGSNQFDIFMRDCMTTRLPGMFGGKMAKPNNDSSCSGVIRRSGARKRLCPRRRRWECRQSGDRPAGQHRRVYARPQANLGNLTAECRGSRVDPSQIAPQIFFGTEAVIHKHVVGISYTTAEGNRLYRDAAHGKIRAHGGALRLWHGLFRDPTLRDEKPRAATFIPVSRAPNSVRSGGSAGVLG